MNDAHLALYAQLVGIGILWVSVHCSGMCGPIMAGLTVSGRPATGDGARVKQPGKDVLGVLLYQSGRALTYALLGAIAGIIGAAAESWIQGITRVVGLVVAVGLILAGFTQFPDFQGLLHDIRRARAKTGPDGKPLMPASARFVGRLFRMLPSQERFGRSGRMFFSGVILGFLPCSLMFWVLSLSAASASPFHGAALMVTLVVLTTPVLLLAGVSSGLLSGRWRRVGAYAIPVSMMFSGFWLALVACAANGWIPHASIPLVLGGQEFVIVLW